MDLDIRPAIDADLPSLAAVARASGLSDIEGGADARYMTFLRTHGRLLVAHDDAIAAYAASVPVGDVTMLTDLFVRPDTRSSGVGGALLAELFRGAGDRMTHSSSDPRAVALYARNGMAPLMPLLYLSGTPDRVTRSLDVLPVGSAEAAAAEASITGVDRTATYAYWVARPDSSAIVVRDGTAVVAAGVIGGENDQHGLTHLAVVSNEYAVAAVTSAVAAQRRVVQIGLPGPHPALRPLLEAGFRIADTDTFMTSGPNPYSTGLAVGSPGLC